MPHLSGHTGGWPGGVMRARLLLALRLALRRGPRQAAPTVPCVHHASTRQGYETNENGAVGIAC